MMVFWTSDERVKDFTASFAALSERRLGMHKKLGGDVARRADPDCQHNKTNKKTHTKPVPATNSNSNLEKPQLL